MDRSDEEAEERPQRAGQPGDPGRNQRDDQGQQQLPDEDVEVQPEGQGDRLGELVDDTQWKVRRDHQEMFDVAAGAAAANAVERKEDEREQGQRQRRIPVIGRRLEPGDEPYPVGDQQKDEERDGKRPKVEISTLQ